MQLSNLPNKISVAFGTGGAKNTIPVASQIGITAGAASYTDGFPPLTRTTLAAGGVPPKGTDMNGVLFDMTAIARYMCAGGVFVYDADFSTAIGGYPKGAVILSAAGVRYRSLVDNNTVAPGGTGWIAAQAAGMVTVAASRTLTAAEAQNGMVLVSGNAGAITLTLPVSGNCDNGAIISFENVSIYPVTLAAGSGDVITTASAGVSTVVLAAGDTLSLAINVNGKSWQTVAGSAQLQYLPSFASSKIANGYQKLPSGLIIQWAQITQPDNGTPVLYGLTLPIAFPNGGLQGFITIGNQINAGAVYCSLEGLTANVASGYTVGPTISRTYRILVIGW